MGTRYELGAMMVAILLCGCSDPEGDEPGDGLGPPTAPDKAGAGGAGGGNGAGASGSTGPSGGQAGGGSLPDPEAALLASIAGEWHGSIGPGYESGCLCLTLDEVGRVVQPSGITLGFAVTGGSTEVVDAAGREIDTTTIVEGYEFHIWQAVVDEAATRIEGLWHGVEIPLDDTISLDRLPESCEERTGLPGAPC